jgi:hypothetical protein
MKRECRSLVSVIDQIGQAELGKLNEAYCIREPQHMVSYKVPSPAQPFAFV